MLKKVCRIIAPLVWAVLIISITPAVASERLGNGSCLI